MAAHEQERAGGPRPQAAAARQVLIPHPPLDEHQERAARVAGAACVVAGAGSGKTRALLGRVHHLLQSGAAPSEIVLCTFTQRAAQEMAARLATVLPASPGQQPGIEIGTLHQVAYRLLQRHGARIGLPRFVVLSADESHALLAACLAPQRAAASSKSKPTVTARQLATLYHRARCEDRSLAEIAPRSAGLEPILDEYARQKAVRGALDFDDLLYFAKLLLEEMEGAGQSAGVRHLLVDEYQDIDQLQAEVLTRLVSGESGALWAVGDPAQAIYGFRGASGALLGALGRRRDVVALALRHNYRATAELVALANRVRARIDDVQLTAQRGPGAPVRVVSCADPDDEAGVVADRVRKFLADGVPPRDLAVLYRSHRQRRRLAEALRALDVPLDDQVVNEVLPTGAVSLCTVHQAKGLEWPVVLLVGLYEGGFPVTRDRSDPADLSEERRLFYVAVTRARDLLLLYHPVAMNGRALVPSRFVLELH